MLQACMVHIAHVPKKEQQQKSSLSQQLSTSNPEKVLTGTSGIPAPSTNHCIQTLEKGVEASEST